MGEVYRAEDTKLKRQVALKVLPADFAGDQERLERFQREAETLAALDHPNIVTIHSVEEADGLHYLTMQLVEGETLTERIPAAGMPLESIIRIAISLADALAAAHQRGVVHRDLKPGNVIVTSDDGVKILDFGLAKLERPIEGVDPRRATTQLMTGEGAVVGTLPYMAPEQVRGEEADARSDIFALGIMLYEMTTGRRPFRGKTGADLITSLLRETPPQVGELRPGLPNDLGRIVRRCLEKEPARRFQTALDVRNELEYLQREASDPAQIADHRPKKIESLAVLPLVDLSGSAEEYFTDGFTEALITHLARLEAVKVISRTSVMQYKGSEQPLPQIARELGVQAVVEGSVLRAGNRVRVTAQLIEAQSDHNLWAESFDRSLRDVLDLQAEIARAIAREIQGVLTPQEEGLIASRGPIDPKAHDLYLKGRHDFHRMTPDGVRRAIRWFRRALTIEPDYAAAHTALGESYGWLVGMECGAPRVLSPLSKEAALKALSIDPTSARARMVVGMTAMVYDWDLVTGERELRRAVEMSPSDPHIRGYLALCLCILGRGEEGLAEIRHAVELDLRSLMINGQLALVFYILRRMDEAIEQAHKTLRIDPSVLISHAVLALSYRQKGMLRESLNEWKHVFALRSSPRVVNGMERAYLKSGFEAALRHAADRLVLAYRLSGLLRFLPTSKRPYVSPLAPATLLIEAGEHDRCIAWLKRAVTARESEVVGLKFFAHWDPLRGDPRFEKLVQRVGV
jgi:serine/threonine protein kinase